MESNLLSFLNYNILLLSIYFISQNSVGGGEIFKTESSKQMSINSELDNIATDQDLRTTVLKNNMQRKENEK